MTDAPDDTATVRNQVVFAYDAWGGVSASWQAHGGAAVTTGGSQSPKVQYAYEDGAAGGEAKYVRLDSVTYPGASRSVYYNYGSSGVGGALGRLENMADDGSGTTKYAQYTYLGASTVIAAEHPAVTDGLVLTYDRDGDHAYAGLDRFGRVADQRWRNTAGTDLDRFRYGYDRDSNRQWREVAASGGGALSEAYAYDALDRLTQSKRGTLDGSHQVSGTPAAQRDYGLEALGNWQTYQMRASGTLTLDQARSHNRANEIDLDTTHGDADDAITASTGADWIDPKYDAGGNMTLCPRPRAESTATEGLLMRYDAWNRLAKVWKDSDGDGVLDEPGDALIVTHRYDGLNRRVAKTVEGGTAVTTDYFYNESWQVLEERRSDKTNVYAQYVWDARYIDAPVLRWQDANDDGDAADANETLYYCNDANMNVTALVNTSGTVVERYAYDPYGLP